MRLIILRTLRFLTYVRGEQGCESYGKKLIMENEIILIFTSSTSDFRLAHTHRLKAITQFKTESCKVTNSSVTCSIESCLQLSKIVEKFSSWATQWKKLPIVRTSNIYQKHSIESVISKVRSKAFD